MNPRPATPRRVAILDVGSNSTRLFLCTGRGAQGPEGTRETVITGLRRGAAADGTIAPEALGRLDACLRGYAPRITAFAPDVIVAVGTSAVRDAPNRSEVVEVVAHRLGVPLRVVSGEEEARLAFSGARLTVPHAAAVTVLDVGGGSTEIVHGGREGPAAAASVLLGSVRSTESHLRSDPPSAAEMAALAAHCEGLLAPAVDAVPRGGTLVGVAGTVTTFAAISLGGYDPRQVHRFRLAAPALEQMVANLSRMPSATRRDVPGLHPERAPVIVAGGVIVLAAMRLLGADELVVGERDLLDGIALAVWGESGRFH